MSASNFHAVPKVPDSVDHLDPDVLVEVLSRHGVNVSDAAGELGLGSADLRRLLCVVVRNSHRARKRGWITTSTSAAELSVTDNAPARTLTFRWRASEDDKRDAAVAEAEHLRENGPVIEHEPQSSNED